jgi:hypothetical protein
MTAAAGRGRQVPDRELRVSMSAPATTTPPFVRVGDGVEAFVSMIAFRRPEWDYNPDGMLAIDVGAGAGGTV